MRLSEPPALKPSFRSLSAKFSVFTGLLVLWVVIVSVGYDLYQNQFDLRKGVLMLAVVLLVALALARFTLRLLVKPLALLEQGMQSVGEGRLTPLRVSRTNDEIQYLGESFNRMIEALAASKNEIREHQEHLEEKIRQRTESLEEAIGRAQAANQAKSEFLANMSHELRTPMNGVIGMIDVVLDGPVTVEQRDHLNTAQSCALTLLSLVNDILDLSKIEAGKMSLEKIPFDVRHMVEECVQAHAIKARQKGIGLCVRDTSPVEAEVLGDPLRFRQIVSNLVSNAVKFTDQGSVEVRFSIQPGEAGRCLLEIEVADTGPGIPAEKIPLVFEKFTQADGSISRRHGGTGLGLAITRRLVEVHGGQITVDSRVGRGSVFRVVLPYALDGAEAERSQTESVAQLVPQPAVFSARILVVEDNLVNQKVVTAILKKKGFKVGIASHGREALVMLARSRYDLVLMDVQMPVMDGIEATRRIRSNARWKNLPVVAVTAHAMQGDRERCLEAGMNEYLSKPVHSAHLLATVISQLAHAPAHSDLAPAALERLPAPVIEEDTSLMESMVHLFLQLAPERLQKMNQAAGRSDFGSVAEEARKLRQAAERIAAAAVVGCALRIDEASGRHDLPALKHSLLLLEAQVAQLRRQADPVEAA